MGSRRILVLAVAIGVAIEAVAGLVSAPAAAEPERRTGRQPVVEVGNMPDVLGAAGVAIDLYRMLAEHDAAREAAAAPLRALGWTPEVCEPEAPGVPMLTDRPCPPIVPSIGHWLAINRCEQGGDWHAYGRFGNGLMGGGGLGMSDGAWREWGGTEFAPTAAGASPWAQMVVASRGYARYGGSPWGCKA